MLTSMGWAEADIVSLGCPARKLGVYSMSELSRLLRVSCAIQIPSTTRVAAAARGDTKRLDFKSHLQVTIILEERESSGDVTTTACSVSMQTGATGDLQRLVYRVS